MNKILAVGIAVLGLFSAILYFMYNYAENKITALETQKNELENKIKGYENAIQEYNRAETKASRTIERIKYVVRNSPNNNCDCYNEPLPDGVLDILRGKD